MREQRTNSQHGPTGRRRHIWWISDQDKEIPMVKRHAAVPRSRPGMRDCVPSGRKAGRRNRMTEAMAHDFGLDPVAREFDMTSESFVKATIADHLGNEFIDYAAIVFPDDEDAATFFKHAVRPAAVDRTDAASDEEYLFDLYLSGNLTDTVTVTREFMSAILDRDVDIDGVRTRDERLETARTDRNRARARKAGETWAAKVERLKDDDMRRAEDRVREIAGLSSSFARANYGLPDDFEIEVRFDWRETRTTSYGGLDRKGPFIDMAMATVAPRWDARDHLINRFDFGREKDDWVKDVEELALHECAHPVEHAAAGLDAAPKALSGITLDCGHGDGFKAILDALTKHLKDNR